VNSKLYETEASQFPAELDAFCELIKQENAASFLEIGSKFGGTLWRVAQVLQPGSKIVAVDLPRGTIKWAKSEPSLIACIERLSAMGHYAQVFWGDSTSIPIVSLVDRLGPFDVVLIDANHTMPYLRQDAANYGNAKVVAFHDIAWSRKEGEYDYGRIDVPEFWNEIKEKYRYREIKLDPTGRDNGIGVLWR